MNLDGDHHLHHHHEDNKQAQYEKGYAKSFSLSHCPFQRQDFPLHMSFIDEEVRGNKMQMEDGSDTFSKDHYGNVHLSLERKESCAVSCDHLAPLLPFIWQ